MIEQDGDITPPEQHTYEVVLCMSIIADTPQQAAQIAGAMLPMTHHATVYQSTDGGQERVVYSQRVRIK